MSLHAPWWYRARTEVQAEGRVNVKKGLIKWGI